MILSIIGGASGVGKTSLLKQFSKIRQINTGDLFKNAMTLANRDEIKKGDWSIFENDVTLSMAKIASESILLGQNLIIDTHFAAKIFGKSYRIGLGESFLCQFGQIIFKLNPTEKLSVNVVLVLTNPYLLLVRRRLDNSRNRELVPSDCYNDLRSNDIYSHRYLSALKTAAKGSRHISKMNYHVINNNVFDFAQEQLTGIMGGT